MVSITFVYLIAGIGLVIGIAIGVVIVGLRQDDSSTSQDRKVNRGVPFIALGLTPKPGLDSYDLLLDNTRYQNPEELGEGERTKILGLMNELWGYAKAEASPIWDYSVEDTSGKAAAHQPQGGNAPVDFPIAPKSTSGLKPMNVLSRALQPESSKVPEKPSSIAAQIDEILQEMIDGTPLESKGIRLFESPTKGLIVLVGMTQFNSVDEVTDEEVRKTIHAAVSEWERRMAPD